MWHTIVRWNSVLSTRAQLSAASPRQRNVLSPTLPFLSLPRTLQCVGEWRVRCSSPSPSPSKKQKTGCRPSRRSKCPSGCIPHRPFRLVDMTRRAYPVGAVASRLTLFWYVIHGLLFSHYLLIALFILKSLPFTLCSFGVVFFPSAPYAHQFSSHATSTPIDISSIYYSPTYFSVTTSCPTCAAQQLSRSFEKWVS